MAHQTMTTLTSHGGCGAMDAEGPADEVFGYDSAVVVDVASSSPSSPSPCSPSQDGSTIETRTMVEDQLVAMLRCQDVYTPSTCMVCSCTSQTTAWNDAAADDDDGIIPGPPGGSPCRVSSFPFPDDKHQQASMVHDGKHFQQQQQQQQHEQNAQPSPQSQQSQQQQLPIPHDEWRSKICEWSYRVVDHFRYDREVVSVAVNYFDRFLVLADGDHQQGKGDKGGSKQSNKESSIDSRTYQLAAMTALYLSVKLHAEQQTEYDEVVEQQQQQQQDLPYDQIQDQYSDQQQHNKHHNNAAPVFPAPAPRRKLKLLSFVELSRGQFSAADITDMESTMLSTLKWRVNPPTPMVFVSHLLRTMPSFVTTTGGSAGPQGAGTASSSSSPPRSSSTRSLERRRDLVLHVLHELSRYLTELSICLPDVSAVYPPGSIAYAAILISLDLMSRLALPLLVREEYLYNLRRLSAGLLDPTSESVTHLRRRMGESFVPEMLADSASAGEGHPIAIAREAGLLDERVERHCDDNTRSDDPRRGFDCMAPTPTPDDEEDDGYVSCEGEVWADHEDADDYDEGDLVDYSASSSSGEGRRMKSITSVIGVQNVCPANNAKSSSSKSKSKAGDKGHKGTTKKSKSSRGHVRTSSWLSSDGEESPVSVVSQRHHQAASSGGQAGKGNPPIPQGRAYHL